ncbi:hypothetical protein AVEN_130385-1 [Araneus ventricosus]|uniref:Uncharacterized protein n=1 Tax=Araneus ventricosus TaxID=182803 RepID=A0A4Y2BEV5_ARAVE|nr:hypothetical protein AVEN_130385-1 [Araneus ventricosus]
MIQSPSHGEPLTSGETETATVINEMKGPDDVIVGVLTVTEDPGRSERIGFTKQSDNINFNLQEFCTLLKEQFRKILSEENKSNTTNYPHVLAVRGDPLDGWYISVPGVSIGWYPSHLAGLLKGIKRRGHSLGLALRVVTVPGSDSQRIGSG